MNHNYLRISADLRRISYWLYEGNTALADSFLARLAKMYPWIDKKIQAQIAKIQDTHEDRLKRSERALTLSAICRTRQ